MLLNDASNSSLSKDKIIHCSKQGCYRIAIEYKKYSREFYYNNAEIRNEDYEKIIATIVKSNKSLTKEIYNYFSKHKKTILSLILLFIVVLLFKDSKLKKRLEDKTNNILDNVTKRFTNKLPEKKENK